MKKLQKLTSALLASSFLLLTPLVAVADQVKLEEGTQVRLKLLDSLSSGTNNEGDSVSFRVVDDVFAADGTTLLIKAGTPAWGTVSQVQERGRMGEKGELALSIEATKAVNGSKVPLRANMNRDGKSKVGSVIALSLIVTPLFLFMKGKDAKIPAGSQIPAYVDRDVLVTTTPPSNLNVQAQVQPVATTEGTPANSPIPEYLQKYVENGNENDEALKALTQLKEQGLLTPEEFEAKKQKLMKK